MRTGLRLRTGTECVVVEPAELVKKAASVPASKVVTVPSVEKAYAPEEDDEDLFAVEERPEGEKLNIALAYTPTKANISIRPAFPVIW